MRHSLIAIKFIISTFNNSSEHLIVKDAQQMKSLVAYIPIVHEARVNKQSGSLFKITI